MPNDRSGERALAARQLRSQAVGLDRQAHNLRALSASFTGFGLSFEAGAVAGAAAAVDTAAAILRGLAPQDPTPNPAGQEAG